MQVRLGSLLDASLLTSSGRPRVRVRRASDSVAIVTGQRPGDGGWTPPSSRVESVPVTGWIGGDATVMEPIALGILAAHERRIGDDVVVRDMPLLSQAAEARAEAAGLVRSAD